MTAKPENPFSLTSPGQRVDFSLRSQIDDNYANNSSGMSDNFDADMSIASVDIRKSFGKQSLPFTPAAMSTRFGVDIGGGGSGDFNGYFSYRNYLVKDDSGESVPAFETTAHRGPGWQSTSKIQKDISRELTKDDLEDAQDLKGAFDRYEAATKRQAAADLFYKNGGISQHGAGVGGTIAPYNQPSYKRIPIGGALIDDVGNKLALLNKVQGQNVNPFSGEMLSGRQVQDAKIGVVIDVGAAGLAKFAAGVKATQMELAALKRIEFAGGPQVYTSDLSHVTGKGAAARNRTIDAIIKEDFPNLELTYKPEYSPFIRTGIAQKNAGTQIGKMNFSSRDSLRDVIIHEELHHRWWDKGIYDHHPLNSLKEAKFYETIERYKRMRGW